MTNRDIFDILRDGDPAAHHLLPDANSPLARSIRATVMANTHTKATTRRRRRVAIIVAAVVAALLATAAAWVLSSRNVTSIGGILCYDAPSLAASAVVVAHPGQAGTDACASLWRDERLPIDDTSPINHDQPLVGCVTAQGTLAVFPSTNHDLCAELGLAEPAQQTSPDPLVELQDQLIEAINPRTCLTTRRAQQVADETLDALGIEDWTVITQHERLDRPCTALSFNTTTNTIHIVPMPKPQP